MVDDARPARPLMRGTRSTGGSSTRWLASPRRAMARGTPSPAAARSPAPNICISTRIHPIRASSRARPIRWIERCADQHAEAAPWLDEQDLGRHRGQAARAARAARAAAGRDRAPARLHGSIEARYSTARGSSIRTSDRRGDLIAPNRAQHCRGRLIDTHFYCCGCASYGSCRRVLFTPHLEAPSGCGKLSSSAVMIRVRRESIDDSEAAHGIAWESILLACNSSVAHCRSGCSGGAKDSFTIYSHV